MAFLNGFKDKALDLAQSGIAKSKQLAEIAKLKAANISEEDNLKKAYIEVGKLYYAERGMAPEAAYAALCEKITACKVNMEENSARIEALKQTSVEESSDVLFESVSCETVEKVKDTPETPEEETPAWATAEPIVPPETEKDEPVSADPVVPSAPPESPTVPVEPLADGKLQNPVL